MSSVRAVIPRLPSMSLAMIAGSLIEENVEVCIADCMLMQREEVPSRIREGISRFKPDLVGVTSTTPLFHEAIQVAEIARGCSRDVVTILGGPHASALPAESLRQSSFDAVVVGEGEKAVKTIARNNSIAGIRGVYSRQDLDGGQLTGAAERADEIPIDQLPMPALHLFNARDYTCPKVISRNNPVGPIEMSRGCIFNCSFCNKNIHGKNFRIKTPERIIEELRVMKRLGYNEFHVLDDQFTTDIAKAKSICEAILKSGIRMPWNLRTGVRVDRIDREFLSLAKRAGCYQVGVGFESGNQGCLDRVAKGIRIEQSVRAVEMIKREGIELVGFFMLGLPGETLETMEETIQFAIKLDPDYAKATVLVPFPGTRIYQEFEREGRIKTKDWSKYNFHNAYEIYTHANLDWNCLNGYYRKFHRRFYLRPGYLAKRLWKAIRRGRLLAEVRYGWETFSAERLRG
jgi:anaerobic magnesium-protoporphyrin IX monomethyl ester cyclase